MPSIFSSRDVRGSDLYSIRHDQVNGSATSESYFTEEDRKLIIEQTEKGELARNIADEFGLTLSEFFYNIKLDSVLDGLYQEATLMREQTRQSQKTEDRLKCIENHDLITDLGQFKDRECSFSKKLGISYNSLVGYIYDHFFVEKIDQVLDQIRLKVNESLIAEDLNLSLAMLKSCLHYDRDVYNLYKEAKGNHRTDDGQQEDKTKPVNQKNNLLYLDYDQLKGEESYNRIYQMVAKEESNEEIADKFGVPEEAISSFIKDDPDLRSLRFKQRKTPQQIELENKHPEIAEKLDKERWSINKIANWLELSGSTVGGYIEKKVDLKKLNDRNKRERGKGKTTMIANHSTIVRKIKAGWYNTEIAKHIGVNSKPLTDHIKRQDDLRDIRELNPPIPAKKRKLIAKRDQISQMIKDRYFTAEISRQIGFSEFVVGRYISEDEGLKELRDLNPPMHLSHRRAMEQHDKIYQMLKEDKTATEMSKQTNLPENSITTYIDSQPDLSELKDFNKRVPLKKRKLTAKNSQILQRLKKEEKIKDIAKSLNVSYDYLSKHIDECPELKSVRDYNKLSPSRKIAIENNNLIAEMLEDKQGPVAISRRIGISRHMVSAHINSDPVLKEIRDRHK